MTLIIPIYNMKISMITLSIMTLDTIDLKRITRCKLALIFTSADHRKFLGLFWF